MRFLLLLGLLALAHSSPLAEPEITTFEQFKAVFGKVYATVEEESFRRANFERSLKYIQENDNKNGAHLAINQMADFGASDLAGINMTAPVGEAYYDSVIINVRPEGNLPGSWDWRSKLGPIESQGSCGACWAFAAMAPVEAQFAIRHNVHVRLSKQEMVDCTRETYDRNYVNNGCTGGYPWEVYKYVQLKGAVEEAAYPYRALNNERCYEERMGGHRRYHINSYHRLDLNAPDESVMTVVKQHGPVAVHIMAHHDAFLHYKSGVMRIVFPGTTAITHAVSIVGWGRENNIDYWLIRNSWGTHWGDQGYGKIERHNNNMGINHYVSFPILN